MFSPMTSLLSIPFQRADGSEAKLQDFTAKAILIVNVASKCGLTPQYEGLENIFEQYKEQGLLVVGFPANDFAGQEPGSDEDIQQFCTLNFGVKFPVMKKIVVKGEGQHALYEALTQAEVDRQGTKATSLLHKIAQFFSGRAKSVPILWNFEKFLVDAEGEVVARFSPEVLPEDTRILKAIEGILS